MQSTHVHDVGLAWIAVKDKAIKRFQVRNMVAWHICCCFLL